jgi:DNA repair protein RadC
LQGMADYELIELLLFLAIPRGDTKPLAKNLLAKFGSLNALLKADEKLILTVPGAGTGVIHVLRLIQSLVSKTLQQEITQKPVLNNWQTVLDYCQATMAYNDREFLRLLFLDKKNQLMQDELQQTGSIDDVPIYPREIIKRTLELGACGLVLIHNHPSGDPTPSRQDIDSTRHLQQAGNLFNIEIHDHLIIGKGKHSSLKTMGLF